MILVDANLLMYAHVSSFPQHETARTWLDECLAAMPRVGLAWPSLLAFARLVRNPRIFTEPEPIRDAWHQVETWLGAASAWNPTPQDGHRKILGECLSVSPLRGNDVPGAHLAAIAIEHGLRLATSDSGFARFNRLEWFNPLEASHH